ncbi:hypothetical protein FACS1894179_05900 [Bacteroidia bacterium]|nr:hypothetical protein FACS1894179_05900 [Bacteroidia bacterium]
MNDSGSIELLPIYGLANRMRTMDSAISLARHFNMKLTVYWEPYIYLYCPYSFLFEPIEGVVIIDMPPGTFGFSNMGTYDLCRPDIFQKYNDALILDASTIAGIKDPIKFFNEIIPQYKNMIIESYNRFYPSEFIYSWVKPRKNLTDLIEKETASFDKNTIGVHIRRTDNKKSIDNSPLDSFYAAMDAEIEKNPFVNFYMASDSLEVKTRLLQRYGNRIITSGEKTNRNTIKGIQRALVELYSLSKTNKILGSYWSSFSSTAAHLGDVPLQTVLIGNAP